MVGVACRFQWDGTVSVREIQMNGRWHAVEQGRQWVDGTGRHVLISLPDQSIRELLLQRDTLTWDLRDVGLSGRTLV